MKHIFNTYRNENENIFYREFYLPIGIRIV